MTPYRQPVLVKLNLFVYKAKYEYSIGMYRCTTTSHYFLFQKINVECVKRASQDGISVFVKALIVNVNKCLKPFFL